MAVGVLKIDPISVSLKNERFVNRDDRTQSNNRKQQL